MGLSLDRPPEPGADDEVTPAKATVEIQYWGGSMPYWPSGEGMAGEGYGKHFRRAAALLKKEFPEAYGKELKLVAKSDYDMNALNLSENFDIRVNGKIVHSKRKGKQGFFDENAEQQKVVFGEVRAALAA